MGTGKLNRFIPTFSEQDLDRINRSGLSKKESIWWVVWTVLQAVIATAVVAAVAVTISLFWAWGEACLLTKPECLPTAADIAELKAYVAQFLISAVVFFSMTLIPYGLVRVDAISSHECGVISFPVFLKLYREDKTRWEILSNHSVALFGQGPRFGTDHYIILFFPPWERVLIAMKINKLMKEGRT